MQRIEAHVLSQALTLGFTIFTSLSVLIFKGRPLLVNSNARLWIFAFAAVAFIAAVYLCTKRATFLPFLGETAFPTHVIVVDPVETPSELAQSGRLRLTVPVPNVPDGSVVVYWASKPEDSDRAVYQAPNEAYAASMNAGACRVKNGKATFSLACPSRYVVRGRTLERHVHYRVQTQPGGMFSGVKTLKVNC